MVNMDSPLESSPTSHRYHSVRFDDTCVLIPDNLPPKIRPRIVTKSYTLPLWKYSSAVVGRPLSDSFRAQTSPEPDRKPFSLTLSVPSLTIARSRRSSIPPPPASPCLSRRLYTQNGASESPSRSSTSPQKLAHCFPQTEHIPVDSDLETVPLRPCCEVCYASVDQAIALGEEWTPHWSRGAVRRRSTGETSMFGITRTWQPSTDDVPLGVALRVDEIEARPQYSGALNPATVNDTLLPPTSSTNDSEEGIGYQVEPALDSTITTDPPTVKNRCIEDSYVSPSDVDDIYIYERDLQAPSVIDSPITSSSPQSQHSMPAQRRRSSFSAASQSLMRGSTSVIRGVSIGVSGVGIVR